MFTFIIPSIRKDSLEYAVGSAINQTYPNFKIIVCGDGVFVPPFENDRILTIIAPRTADQSKTRMYAAKYAQTEWCVFLDDDDWVAPDYLEHFIPHVTSSDIIVSQMNNYGTVMPADDHVIHGQIGISFAVRTDVLLANPFPPPPSEDYVFLKNAQEAGLRISFTHYCGYFVRRFLGDPYYTPTPL